MEQPIEKGPQPKTMPIWVFVAFALVPVLLVWIVVNYEMKIAKLETWIEALETVSVDE